MDRAFARVGLRLHVGPSAFGNALGSSIADAVSNTDSAKTSRTLNEINESRRRNGLELIDGNDSEAMSIVKDIARAKDLKRAGDRIDFYGDKLLLEGNATENQVTETVDALKNSFTDKSYAIQGSVAPGDVSSFGKPIDHLFKGAGRLANSFGGFMGENPVAMYALQGIEFAAAPGFTALRMAATELTPLGDMIAAAQKTMIDTVANKMANDGYGHEDAVNGGTGAFVMASVLGVGVAGAISRIDSVANVIAGVRNRFSQAANNASGNLDVSQPPIAPAPAVGSDFRSDRVTLYRVDDNAFPPRINSSGVPVVSTGKGGERALFVNLGQPDRAKQFHDVNRKSNATVTAVDVDVELLNRLRRQSVHDLSPDAKLYPTAPLKVDIKAPDQFGLRTPEHLQWLRDSMYPSTIRVIDPNDL